MNDYNLQRAIVQSSSNLKADLKSIFFTKLYILLTFINSPSSVKITWKQPESVTTLVK